MTRVPILRYPDARLQTPCEPVTPGPEVTQLVRDMFETMYAAPGRGLAAPQIGVLSRVFVMDAGWKDGAPRPFACLNPVVTPLGDPVQSPEGCLSIPGITTVVQRRAEARLVYTDLSGQTHDLHLTGAEAICAQHEADHLDGIVTFDRMVDAAEALAEYEAQA